MTQNQLSDAIDVISDGFALLDSDDRFVMINARFRDIYASVVDALVPGASYRDFVRRLAERPANLTFFLRALVD